MLTELQVHHYVSKKQAQYLRDLKATVPKHEAIILMNFAENYSFLVQDAPQSYHWNNTQATIHPITVYYRLQEDSRNGIAVKCCAVISDCLEHDTVNVHTFQAELLNAIKKEMPQTTKVHYFADGASAQYKNRKNVANLCHHETDLGISATWNFFCHLSWQECVRRHRWYR